MRIKGGTRAHKRHKKILGLAKGYRMTRHKQYRVAKQAVLHAGEYAFAGRKLRKRNFRQMWIVRMNAALKTNDIKYSIFINMLKKESIEIDRKILAHIAVEMPEVFKNIVSAVKK